MDTNNQVTHNKKNDIEYVKYISMDFLLKNDIDPFFIKLNSTRFSSYEIVDVEGQYVAIKLLFNKCLAAGACRSERFLILKVVPQGDSFAIEPYGYNNDQYLSYWWQMIEGKYPR